MRLRLWAGVLLCLALAVPGVAQKKICIYDVSSSFVSNVQSLLGSGYIAVRMPATTWAAMSLSDFRTCAAIFVPDTDNVGSYGALTSSRNVWVQAVTGPVILSGVHMGGHGLNGGVGRVVKGFMDYLTTTPGRTGFLMGTDRTETNGPTGFTNIFQVEIHSDGACDDDIRIVTPVPSYLSRLTQPISSGGFGVTQTDLANQGCSAHNFFRSRPNGVWDVFAKDNNQTPVRDVIITRNSGGITQTSGDTSVFTNRAGGQIFTPTGTTTFTFQLTRTLGTTFLGMATLPGQGRVIQICRGPNGIVLVTMNGRSSRGNASCAP